MKGIEEAIYDFKEAIKVTKDPVAAAILVLSVRVSEGLFDGAHNAAERLAQDLNVHGIKGLTEAVAGISKSLDDIKDNMVP